MDKSVTQRSHWTGEDICHLGINSTPTPPNQQNNCSCCFVLFALVFPLLSSLHICVENVMQARNLKQFFFFSRDPFPTFNKRKNRKQISRIRSQNALRQSEGSSCSYSRDILRATLPSAAGFFIFFLCRAP